MPPYVGKGQPRKFCPECRPPRNKPAKLPEPAPVDVESGVFAATMAELRAAGRETSAKGKACLLLAERLDAKIDTAAGAAAAVKQLREALDDALAGATFAADPVDELRRRREAKFA